MPETRPRGSPVSDAEDLLQASERGVLLTVKEYAAFKKVHPETVRRWIRAGHVKATRTVEPHGHLRIVRPLAL